MVPAILLVLTITFTLIHLAPGDPIYAIIGEFPASEEYVRQVRTEFGLDKPLHVQFVIYVGKILRGDLGYSYKYRQSVSELIIERIPATLLLQGLAWGLAILLGVFLGVASSKRPYSIVCLLYTSDAADE